MQNIKFKFNSLVFYCFLASPKSGSLIIIKYLFVIQINVRNDMFVYYYWTFSYQKLNSLCQALMVQSPCLWSVLTYT